MTALLLSGCGMAGDSSLGKAEGTDVFTGVVPRATCGPGSSPETGLQGQVPLEDRQSGRSLEGYRCNLELVGRYAGEGASWQHAWYEDCAYFGQRLAPPVSSSSLPAGVPAPSANTSPFGGAAVLKNPGVIALDVSDPANPRYTTNLATAAMLDPWESLKSNERRGLLGGVAGWNVEGATFFDLYDLKGDCAHPALAASLPVNLPFGHEGNFSFDGMTYYGTGTVAPTWTAIDISDPTLPKTIFALPYPQPNHGLATSEDGNRVYAMDLFGTGGGTGGPGLASGVTIWDVTGVQSRTTRVPVVVSSLSWTSSTAGQHVIPIFYGDKPYLLTVDEGGGGVNMIDISDERAPELVTELDLEVHTPENAAAVSGDTAGAGGFGYSSHYCGVDRTHDPTVAGCSFFQSGVRIFDIRDPLRPREIAYFNPGGLGTSPPASNRNGTSNSGYTSAQVRFIAERGEIWFTDQDSGFIVARFTNGVWPFSD